MPKPKAKSTQASTHNLADYVVYTISVPNIADHVLTKLVSDALAAHQIPGSYQQIRPGVNIYDEDGETIIGQQPSDVQVPRLCTFWRGQEQEDAWVIGIREALKKLDLECEIICGPWASLPGFPKGAIED